MGRFDKGRMILFGTILLSLHPVNPNPLLPSGRIANFCSCNGQLNSKGEGECLSSYRGIPFCYTDPGVCEDAVKSTSSERWWSYQACDNKKAKCSCNGEVNSKGEGECKSKYRGRPFCYTNPGLCSDQVESTSSEGGWWSYKACKATSATTTEKPNSQVLFPEQPIVEQKRICKCNGRLNSRGEGECGSTYRGRAFCYVEQGLCRDEVASTADGWWSYQACQQTEKNNPGTTRRPSIEAPAPEQPFEDIFVKENPRAPLTAANYCPDQCSVLPDGSTVCSSSQCAMPTCQYQGTEYTVGDTFWENDNDVCSNMCECKAIFVSTDPLKVGGAVDCQVVPCTKCTHKGKSFPVGAFNDGCNNCVCDEFGGVTCSKQSSSNSGIIPRIVPGCNSDDPLVDSIDLEVNSRIPDDVIAEKNSKINFGPDPWTNSSENLTFGQIPKVSADIIQTAALVEEKEICPLEEPRIGTPCTLPPSSRCSYGEECCCGECSPSLVLSCFDGSWGGFNTDFCFRPDIDSC